MMIQMMAFQPDSYRVRTDHGRQLEIQQRHFSGFDVSGFLDACQKDNTILFRADGNATLDEGNTKCEPGDPQTISFGWNFMANEAGIHVSAQLFEGGGTEFNLERLTSSVLEVSQNIDIGSGSSQKVTVTFTH